MSQNQIMSLNLLNMATPDLRNEIYAKAERNPALEILDDSMEDGAKKAVLNQNEYFSDNFYYGKASLAQSEASDNFQAALESSADLRETLTEHLEHQLNSMNLPPEQYELCKKLIYNLDFRGFHILSPSALLDKSDPQQTEEFLNQSLTIIQNMDPAGTCTANFTESLYVQAQILGNPSECTLFLLQHFDFLNPPQSEKILKKIKAYIEEQKKLKFNSFTPFEHDEEDIEEALEFIKKLDPFPARNFGSSQTSYILPDVKIVKNPESAQSGESEFSVILQKNYLPKMVIARDFEKLLTQENKALTPEQLQSQQKFARASINDARAFIEGIEYRQSTILKACLLIAEKQKQFFEKGPGYLLPLRQKDLSEALGVHETTVSRMANSKYIDCSWGIFPVSFFFTNAVGKEEVSKDSIKSEIAKLLEEHKNDRKPLSDQKICDLLAERGIKIARRTVAKYRSQENISSSYSR